MPRILGLLAALVMCCPAQASDLSSLSNRDAVSGLKEALVKSAQASVSRLGVQNGFSGNERVKIPLPESLTRVEGLMRSFGLGAQADELVLRMNRAAEAAVPEARALLVDAARKMSIQDAKGILTGGEDSATRYFRQATSAPLAQRFLPIVQNAMHQVQLAEAYNRLAEPGVRFGLLNREDANLEAYITRKALDGLFLVMADEEKKLRQDPVGSTSAIIRKVFGSLGR
jgi:hypothetical protein